MLCCFWCRQQEQAGCSVVPRQSSCTPRIFKEGAPGVPLYAAGMTGLEYNLICVYTASEGLENVKNIHICKDSGLPDVLEPC